MSEPQSGICLTFLKIITLSLRSKKIIAPFKNAKLQEKTEAKKLKKKITNPLTNLLDKPNKKANKNKYYYNILLAFYYDDRLLYFEFDFEKTF